MPIAGWNGKFEAVGNGGWAGRINYALYGESLSSEIQRGYATASTDTGHVGQADFDASFALGHPEQLVDFGYRAVHEMTIAAKVIVEACYRRQATRSYWKGCSTGGREGLMEAQRYPADYDGIIAGAPANYWTHLMTKGLWNYRADTKDPATILPREKAAMLHAAVINACDALDGAKDGIIEDPTRCRFDPKMMACTGEDRPDCLTAAQLDGVITAGATRRFRLATPSSITRAWRGRSEATAPPAPYDCSWFPGWCTATCPAAKARTSSTLSERSIGGSNSTSRPFGSSRPTGHAAGWPTIAPTRFVHTRKSRCTEAAAASPMPPTSSAGCGEREEQLPLTASRVTDGAGVSWVRDANGRSPHADE